MVILLLNMLAAFTIIIIVRTAVEMNETFVHASVLAATYFCIKKIYYIIVF